MGKLPVWLNGVSTEVVGIEDVADAFLLAGEHGRVGERYIISETYMPMREMLDDRGGRSRCEATAVGYSARGDVRFGGFLGVAGRLLRRDLADRCDGDSSCCTSCRLPTTVRRRANSAGSRVPPRSRYGRRRSSMSTIEGRIATGCTG